MSLLELPLLAAIRRNHALEHATVNILSGKYLDLSLVGRSDWAGFTLYGPVSTDDAVSAVAEGLRRLRSGERELAVHERCGTNLATGVILAGLASRAALGGKRRTALEKAMRLGLGLGAVLVLAQPLGLAIQRRWTTSPDLAGLRVTSIERRERGGLVIHRIGTA